jgi:hypothetical protein
MRPPRRALMQREAAACGCHLLLPPAAALLQVVVPLRRQAGVPLQHPLRVASPLPTTGCSAPAALLRPDQRRRVRPAHAGRQRASLHPGLPCGSPVVEQRLALLVQEEVLLAIHADEEQALAGPDPQAAEAADSGFEDHLLPAAAGRARRRRVARGRGRHGVLPLARGARGGLQPGPIPCLPRDQEPTRSAGGDGRLLLSRMRCCVRLLGTAGRRAAGSDAGCVARRAGARPGLTARRAAPMTLLLLACERRRSGARRCTWRAAATGRSQLQPAPLLRPLLAAPASAQARPSGSWSILVAGAGAAVPRPQRHWRGAHQQPPRHPRCGRPRRRWWHTASWPMPAHPAAPRQRGVAPRAAPARAAKPQRRCGARPLTYHSEGPCKVNKEEGLAGAARRPFSRGSLAGERAGGRSPCVFDPDGPRERALAAASRAGFRRDGRRGTRAGQRGRAALLGLGERWRSAMD